jgi:hypothetical protein
MASATTGIPSADTSDSMGASVAKKFTKCAHQIAAISRSRDTIGYCVEIKSSESVSRASWLWDVPPCERGRSVNEPNAVDPDPGAALNAFANPGRTRRVDSIIACAVGPSTDF